jgi:hypothetical protein
MPFFYGYRGMGERGSRLTESTKLGDPEPSNEGLLVHRRVCGCEITSHGITRKELRGEAQIFVAPERLWQLIITNQKIRAPKEITNPEAKRRSYLKLAKIPFTILGNRGKVTKANLTRLEQSSELGWKRRKFILPGLYERETLFKISPHAGAPGTTLVQTETFRGILVPFLTGDILAARRDIQLSMMELREKAENIS